MSGLVRDPGCSLAGAWAVGVWATTSRATPVHVSRGFFGSDGTDGVSELRAVTETAQDGDAHAADAALVLAVAAGDRKALASLYDRHGSAMLGLGVRVLRNRRDAEDVLHDVFLEVWRRAHTYDRARASVRGWLFLMMRCRALDRRKSAAFARSTSLEVNGLDAIASQTSALTSPDARGDAASLALDHKRAIEALARLPETQRAVVILGYFEGLSSSEIASELALPIGTVKSRVAAAMRALRDSLGVERDTAAAEEVGRS